MKDIFFLNQKSEPATKADDQVVQDLLDTLKSNEAHCVGMAANMIGVKKQKQKYSGWIAQIIQHEVDHLSGVII
jgi:peptide deformylase